jgi:hypothetical protein
VKTVVTKGEFARRKNRGPSAVSNWISSGKISEAALVGKGNAAKIWLERAEADLAASLDPSQQLMQASPILPAAAQALPQMADPPAPMPSLSPGLPPPPAAKTGQPSERELDLARRAKADADRAEHDAEAARRKLLVDEGKYVIAEDAARAWGRELAKLMSEIETFMSSTLSRELAERHGLDWKALTVEMREAFRKFRAGVSDDARARREALEPEAAEGEGG